MQLEISSWANVLMFGQMEDDFGENRKRHEPVCWNLCCPALLRNFKGHMSLIEVLFEVGYFCLSGLLM